MRLSVAILILACSFTFLSCANKKNTATADQSSETITATPFEVIRYEKTPCFGTCPQFTMTVRSDGFAFYQGKRFVEMEGSWRGECNQKQIEEVLLKAQEIGFLDMEDSYDNHLVTDLPSTTAVLTVNSQTKSVLNRYEGPKELAQLYEVLDKIIEDVKWKQDTDN